MIKTKAYRNSRVKPFAEREPISVVIFPMTIDEQIAWNRMETKAGVPVMAKEIGVSGILRGINVYGPSLKYTPEPPPAGEGTDMVDYAWVLSVTETEAKRLNDRQETRDGYIATYTSAIQSVVTHVEAMLGRPVVGSFIVKSRIHKASYDDWVIPLDDFYPDSEAQA